LIATEAPQESEPQLAEGPEPAEEDDAVVESPTAVESSTAVESPTGVESSAAVVSSTDAESLTVTESPSAADAPAGSGASALPRRGIEGPFDNEAVDAAPETPPSDSATNDDTPSSAVDIGGNSPEGDEAFEAKLEAWVSGGSEETTYRYR